MMMKAEKLIKRTSFGSRMRKRMSDITNLQSQHKSPFKNQENSLPSDDCSSKNHIQQLLKENAMMINLIAEKDKIIDSKELELQSLRVNLQKTQLQNWHLAQSNSQMLAELNMAKDRLKALQHEFVCKDYLFKAMALELQEGKTKPEEDAVKQPLEDNNNIEKMVSKTKRICPERSQSMGPTTSQVEVDKETGTTKPEEASVKQPLEDNNDDKKTVSKTKRIRPARSQSMGPTTTQLAVDKETVENKRRCLRRQSVRLKHREKQDDLFEIDVANSTGHQTMDSAHLKSNSDVAEDEKCLSESSKCAGSQRLSVGRPQRRAAEKVQSYKDPPLNIKMRRPY